MAPGPDLRSELNKPALSPALISAQSHAQSHQLSAQSSAQSHLISALISWVLLPDLLTAHPLALLAQGAAGGDRAEA